MNIFKYLWKKKEIELCYELHKKERQKVMEKNSVLKIGEITPEEGEIDFKTEKIKIEDFEMDDIEPSPAEQLKEISKPKHIDIENEYKVLLKKI